VVFVGCVNLFRNMSVVPLSVDIAVIFCVIACLHYHYGNWRKHHIIVTVATFLSWFLPTMIIFVLPVDVSSVSTTVLFSLIIIYKSPVLLPYTVSLCSILSC